VAADSWLRAHASHSPLTLRGLYFFFHKLESNLPIVSLLLFIYTRLQH